MAAREDDVQSEVGDPDPFRPGVAAQSQQSRQDVPRTGFTRVAEKQQAGWGHGPAVQDKRKFRYDVLAAQTRKPLTFGATKVDRLDATVAGDLLDRIHKTFGIDRESEERIWAFDQGLWYEHAVNGGSTLQAERGVVRVEEVEFDIPVVIKILGTDARRFFRAYADEIAATLKKVLDGYNPFVPEASEMYAAVMQVAVARGLQKYPHLIHDSSDAGVELSIEERMALQASKRYVIASVVNAADSVPGRVGAAAGYGSSAAVHVDSA